MTDPFALTSFAAQRRQRLMDEAQQHRLLREARRTRYRLTIWRSPAEEFRRHWGRDKSQPLRTRQLT